MNEASRRDTVPSAPPARIEPLDLVWLVREHYGDVYRYAFRLSGSQSDAEDLTQQTFLVVQGRLHQVREPEKILRWLFAVLRSCFLKSFRRQRPVAAGSIELDVEQIPEHRIAACRLDQQDVQTALNELPDDYRIVVLMFYFEELSYQEIAIRLELPIGTVMSRLSRAKGRMRQRFFADDVPPPAKPRDRKKVSLP